MKRTKDVVKKALFFRWLCSAKWTLFLLFIFLSVVFSKAYGSDWEEYNKYGDRNPRWDSLVEAGFNSFDSGNLAGGEMFLQRALSKGCKDGLAYFKIGLFYEAQGNYQKASEFFRLAVKNLPSQYPKHEAARSVEESFGRVLFLLGQTNEAETHLKRALESSESFTSLYFLGQILREKGKYEEAIKYFERSLKAEHPPNLPRSIDILIMTELGRAYYDLNNYDLSLIWWKNILTIDPQNNTAQSYKAKIEQMKFKEKERQILEGILQ